MPKYLAVVLTALLAATAAPRSIHADEAKCFANWSDADAVVRREQLVAVEQVSALARSTMAGAVVIKSTLCEDQGRYTYRLILREAHGQLTTLNVDARRPFEK